VLAANRWSDGERRHLMLDVALEHMGGRCAYGLRSDFPRRRIDGELDCANAQSVRRIGGAKRHRVT
jgi:hypothetical protein